MWVLFRGGSVTLARLWRQGDLSIEKAFLTSTNARGNPAATEVIPNQLLYDNYTVALASSC